VSKVICDLTISADGYSAGPNQTEERPFGDDGGDGWGNRLRLFDGVPPLNLEQIEARAASSVVHVTYRVLS
jgi:hypothetical protein